MPKVDAHILDPVKGYVIETWSLEESQWSDIKHLADGTDLYVFRCYEAGERKEAFCKKAIWLQLKAQHDSIDETAAIAGAGIDLKILAAQFQGRKFGELILEHVQKQDFRTVVAALLGTIDELPPSAREISEAWIDEIGPKGRDEAFWRRDCGEALMQICELAKPRLAARGIPLTGAHLLTMFQIIVLNFAYGALKDPQSKAFIQKAIGIGFLRRLFKA